jgi:hypothetical protein
MASAAFSFERTSSMSHFDASKTSCFWKPRSMTTRWSESSSAWYLPEISSL